MRSSCNHTPREPLDGGAPNLPAVVLPTLESANS